MSSMQKLAILLLLACAACSTKAGDPAPSQPSKPAMEAPASAPVSAAAPAPAAKGDPALLAQIRAKIGKAECSSDSQCQVVPIGAKACGGAATYLAWSSAHTDGTELQALADRYREQQRENNRSTGRISDCRVVAPPAVACRAGTCQLGDALSAM